MQMAFFASNIVGPILFKGWKVTNAAGIFGSCIVVIVVAIIHEAIKSYQAHRKKAGKKQDSEATPLLHKTSHQNHLRHWVDVGDRLKATLLYMFQFLVSYILMLFAMTYSVWLFLAVVLGCGVGYYLVNPLMEHCFSQQIEKRSQIESYVTF